MPNWWSCRSLGSLSMEFSSFDKFFRVSLDPFCVLSRSWRQLTNLAKIPEGTRHTWRVNRVPQAAMLAFLGKLFPCTLYDLDLWGFNFTPFQQFKSEEEPATRVWGLYGLVGYGFCLLSLGINVSMRYHNDIFGSVEASWAWNFQAPDQWCAPKERAKFPVS